MPYNIPTQVAKVSVIMSAYNSATYIAEAIESIVAQTFPFFILIAVDDGSTDRTRAIIEGYAQRDARIHLVVNEENIGIAASHNKALWLCTTPYIAPFGADDMVVSDWLQKKYEFMEQHPELAVLGNAQQSISSDGSSHGTIWAPSSSPHKIQQSLLDSGTGIPHGSSLIRTEAAKELGGYRENFVAALDVDFWLRLSEKYAIGCLPDILQYYRQHPHSISQTRATTQACNHVLAMIASEKRRKGEADPLTGKELNLTFMLSLLESGTQSALLWFNLLSLREIASKEDYICGACRMAYQRPCSPSFLRQQIPTWYYFMTHFPRCTEEMLAAAQSTPIERWQENVRRVSQGARLLHEYAATLQQSDAPGGMAQALSEYSRVIVRQLLYGDRQ